MVVVGVVVVAVVLTTCKIKNYNKYTVVFLVQVSIQRELWLTLSLQLARIHSSLPPLALPTAVLLPMKAVLVSLHDTLHAHAIQIYNMMMMMRWMIRLRRLLLVGNAWPLSPQLPPGCDAARPAFPARIQAPKADRTPLGI